MIEYYKFNIKPVCKGKFKNIKSVGGLEWVRGEDRRDE